MPRFRGKADTGGSHTVGPPRPQALRPMIQPAKDGKYLGKKIPESSQRQNLNFPPLGTSLHGIYLALGVIRNVEVAKGGWEDVCRLGADATLSQGT